MKFTTHLELHSQTTRLVEGASPRPSHRSQTGFSPSPTAHPRALGPGPDPKHPLQITTRTPGKGPDFKFELLPLHSPLLRQSRLVSFPPLIDMLKFSGYPYLIRGQPKGEDQSFDRLSGRGQRDGGRKDPCITAQRTNPPGAATAFRARPPAAGATGGRWPNKPSRA
jgi:hypothetical protein